jgi:hypothetical protein
MAYRWTCFVEPGLGLDQGQRSSRRQRTEAGATGRRCARGSRTGKAGGGRRGGDTRVQEEAREVGETHGKPRSAMPTASVRPDRAPCAQLGFAARVRVGGRRAQQRRGICGGDRDKLAPVSGSTRRWRRRPQSTGAERRDEIGKRCGLEQL